MIQSLNDCEQRFEWESLRAERIDRVQLGHALRRQPAGEEGDRGEEEGGGGEDQRIERMHAVQECDYARMIRSIDRKKPIREKF